MKKNTLSSLTILLVTSILSIMLVALFFSAGAHASRQEVVGTVVHVEQAPMECYERRNNTTSSPVIMAIAGGLAGNQFGSGSGKKAMTAIGAIAGAATASSNRAYNSDRIDCRSDGYLNTIQYTDRYGRVAQVTKQTASRLPLNARLRVMVR